MSNVFTVSLYCLNCGNDWQINVARGTEVRGGFGVWLHPSDCFGHPCKGKKAECPNCGRDQEVHRNFAKAEVTP